MPDVTFRFEGRPITAAHGMSIGAALWAAGVREWRLTRIGGRPRAMFCGIGQCFDCLVRVTVIRACITTAGDGDEVTRG